MSPRGLVCSQLGLVECHWIIGTPYSAAESFTGEFSSWVCYWNVGPGWKRWITEEGVSLAPWLRYTKVSLYFEKRAPGHSALEGNLGILFTVLSHPGTWSHVAMYLWSSNCETVKTLVTLRDGLSASLYKEMLMTPLGGRAECYDLDQEHPPKPSCAPRQSSGRWIMGALYTHQWNRPLVCSGTERAVGEWDVSRRGCPCG